MSRFELVILARLSSAKSPSDKQLAEVIRDLAAPDRDSNPEQVAAQTLAELRRRGLVHEPTKRARNRRTLTDSGVRALRAGFDLDKTPVWKDVHKTHLLACALGIAPNSVDAETATKDATNIAHRVVRNHYKTTE
ncbi:MAG TPA: hypothetical protein VFP84_05765, partial [Kofleriaceae bacterium]|nr:hypothetical protein [Kofleriaceae bacterium]